MKSDDTSNKYDSEPVCYCTRCYSLKIKYEKAIGFDCCMECGSLDIAKAPIEVWEQLYERRYGRKHVEKNEDPRKSFIFKLPIEKLKSKVYDSPVWKKIIKSLYPKFPGGLSKVDSVILFFDKLIKDNRIDDLKLFLTKHSK